MRAFTRHICVLMAIAWGTATSFGQGACENFVPASLDETALQQQFRGAVLRLGTNGTGYLIDSAGGYILTAAHVIRGYIQDPGHLIEASSPDKPKSFELKIVRVLEHEDLALLQVKNLDAISGIRPLDIAMHIPERQMVLQAMGYPKIGDETNEDLRLFPAKFSGEITHSGLIEVQQQAYFGNSGGPLVDPSGSALGTCEEEAGGNNLARYMPSASAKTLIELIPLSPRMQELDDRFRAGLERNELVRILTKASDTPTNLELYLWLKKIGASKANYSKLKDFLTCPLLYALADRRVYDAVLFFVGKAEPPVTSKAGFEVGKREAALGRLATALQASKLAVEEFTRSNDRLGRAKAELLMGNVLEQSGAYHSARDAYQEALKDVGTTNPPELRAEALMRLGSVNEKRGKYRQASANYTEAALLLRETGRDTEAAATFVDLAKVDEHRNRLQSALDYLEKALGIYNEKKDNAAEAATWYQLGKLQLQTNNIDDAKKSFAKSLALDPGGERAADAKAILGTSGLVNGAAAATKPE